MLLHHQIIIQMLLSLLFISSLSLCLCIQYALCLFTSIPPSHFLFVYLSIHSLPCFGLCLSLRTGLKSTSRGVCGWGRPATCRSLYWKWVLYFSRGQQAVSACVFILFYFREMKADRVQTQQNHITEDTAARNLIHVHIKNTEIWVHQILSYSNAQARIW